MHRPGIVPIELHQEQETALVKIHIIQINSLIKYKNARLQHSVVVADALYTMFVPSIFCTNRYFVSSEFSYYMERRVTLTGNNIVCNTSPVCSSECQNTLKIKLKSFD